MLVERKSGIRRVVTHTTRLPRAGEKDGVDYHFVTRETFEDMIKRGEFVEYAVVHGNYYGTSRKALEDVIKKGYDAVLAIDVQGARRVMGEFDNVVSIFILPPSFEEWLDRLKRDNTRSDLNRRLQTALSELDELEIFDFCIVNDEIERAYNALSCIVEAERNDLVFIKRERKMLAQTLREKIKTFLEV